MLDKLATSQNSESAWNVDGLAEDVASISYERALCARARARLGSSDPVPPSTPAESRKTGTAAKALPLKTSSITIRFSEPECAQLRRRASEAGMTVSAYLRSCTLEVESLRAQVKQTLAEIRNSTPKPPESDTKLQSDRGIGSLLARLREWYRLISRRRHPDIGLNPVNPFAPIRY